MRGLAAIFKASACSRPPEPMIRMFMRAVVYHARPQAKLLLRRSDRLAVLVQQRRYLRRWAAAEPAIGGEAELRQVRTRRRHPLWFFFNVAAPTEINAGRARPQPG